MNPTAQDPSQPPVIPPITTPVVSQEATSQGFTPPPIPAQLQTPVTPPARVKRKSDNSLLVVFALMCTATVTLVLGTYIFAQRLQPTTELLVNHDQILKNKTPKVPVATTSATQTTQPSAIDISTWKVYTNNALKFKFSYPDDYKIEQESADGVYFSSLFQPGDQVVSTAFTVNFKPTIDLETLKKCKDTTFQNNVISKCLDSDSMIKDINGVQMNVFHVSSGSLNSQSSSIYIYQVIGNPKIEFIHKIYGGGIEPRVDQILSTFKFTK